MRIMVVDVGCHGNGHGVTKCVGVNHNVFNITSSGTVKNLTIDCINRSEIKSLNRGDVHNLQSLQIFNCGMEIIGQQAFEGSDTLERISLRHNFLARH